MLSTNTKDSVTICSIFSIFAGMLSGTFHIFVILLAPLVVAVVHCFLFLYTFEASCILGAILTTVFLSEKIVKIFTKPRHLMSFENFWSQDFVIIFVYYIMIFFATILWLVKLSFIFVLNVLIFFVNLCKILVQLLMYLLLTPVFCLFKFKIFCSKKKFEWPKVKTKFSWFYSDNDPAYTNTHLNPWFIIGLLFFSLFSFDVIVCEGPSFEELPVAMKFENLHITDNFTSAIKAVKGLAGIYCIRCVVTGAMYIGSTTNLGRRLNNHFIESTNIHLRNAINLYGVSAFEFIVVEFVEILAETPSSSIKALLLMREQSYLNWLFSLPENLRFNFLPLAGSCLGLKHTDEIKAKYSGENHYAHGLVAHNAKTVSIFTLEGELVQSFPSLLTAANFLGISQVAVCLAIKRRSIVKKMYRVISS